MSFEHQNINDILVIGGGLMGSSAAWHLSKNGEKVCLIEQQDSVYTSGSSLGEARISRSLGPKNDIFSYLHNRSVSETKILIEYLNKKEGSETHRMEDVYTTSPVTYIYYSSWKKTVERLLRGQTDPYEYASGAKDALQKFGMVLPDSAMVLREYKKYSGTLNPKELIKKLHTAIQHSYSEIRYNRKVTRLIKKRDLFEVEILDTETREIQTVLSKKIVLGAGPYTGKLLRDLAPEFEKLISPKRVFLVFLKIKPERYDSLTSFQKKKIREFYPVADFTSELMFSMIERVDSEGIPILKIGGHLIREEIQDLDQVWDRNLSLNEKRWGIETTFTYLQQLNIPVQKNDLQYLHGYSCVYSQTSSEVPFVTNILDKENQPEPHFIVLGGMSGVGAKGTMTYGLIGANLLMQQEEDSEIYNQTKNALGPGRLLEPNGERPSSSNKQSNSATSWFIPES